jgi:6-phosphofructokinase 2
VEAPEVAVRSAVGAGDSMLAGIVHGLAQGMELVDAARLGVAAGTAASLTPGTELCRREDVERLHDEIRREAQR